MLCLVIAFVGFKQHKFEEKVGYISLLKPIFDIFLSNNRLDKNISNPPPPGIENVRDNCEGHHAKH